MFLMACIEITSILFWIWRKISYYAKKSWVIFWRMVCMYAWNRMTRVCFDRKNTLPQNRCPEYKKNATLRLPLHPWRVWLIYYKKKLKLEAHLTFTTSVLCQWGSGSDIYRKGKKCKILSLAIKKDRMDEIVLLFSHERIEVGSFTAFKQEFEAMCKKNLCSLGGDLRNLS